MLRSQSFFLCVSLRNLCNLCGKKFNRKVRRDYAKEKTLRTSAFCFFTVKYAKVTQSYAKKKLCDLCVIFATSAVNLFLPLSTLRLRRVTPRKYNFCDLCVIFATSAVNLFLPLSTLRLRRVTPRKYNFCDLCVIFATSAVIFFYKPFTNLRNPFFINNE
jgi:hypothetical protein